MLTLTYKPGMNIPTPDEIITQIERFLERHQMARTRFGREATGEPQLLDSLISGRSPTLKLLTKIADFMAAYDAENPTASSGKETAFTGNEGATA